MRGIFGGSCVKCNAGKGLCGKRDRSHCNYDCAVLHTGTCYRQRCDSGCTGRRDARIARPIRKWVLLHGAPILVGRQRGDYRGAALLFGSMAGAATMGRRRRCPDCHSARAPHLHWTSGAALSASSTKAATAIASDAASNAPGAAAATLWILGVPRWRRVRKRGNETPWAKRRNHRNTRRLYRRGDLV